MIDKNFSTKRRSGDRPSIENTLSYSSHNSQPLYGKGDTSTPKPRQGMRQDTPTRHHKARCERLLKAGGIPKDEISFLWSLKSQHSPSKAALERLSAIEESGKPRELRRLCRYCWREALIIDQFAYRCDRCGDCLNLDWKGGRNDG